MHYLIIFKKLCGWGEEMLKNSFGKNSSVGPLKGISPFAPKIFKSTVFTVCHTSVMKTSLRTCYSSNKYPLVWGLSLFWYPCRTIKNFLSFFISHRDLTSLKKMKTPKWIEKKSIKMGEKKKEEKMGMSTITQQSNHQRKERKTSQNQSLRLKSLPLRRQRFVSLLITMYTLLLQNWLLLLILNWTCYHDTRMDWIWYDSMCMVCCLGNLLLSTWIRYL